MSVTAAPATAVPADAGDAAGSVLAEPGPDVAIAPAWRSFTRAAAGGPAGSLESNLAIEGMDCAACALTVEAALRALPGVHEAGVDAAAHTARVVWSPRLTEPSRWMRAVAAAGYRAEPAPFEGLRQARRRAARLLLWRLLVAAFCMMQVMMYATPAYVAGPGDMSRDMAQLLRWASWVLTLPVLLFSCQPFFAGAWRDLRQGRLGMDVPVALGIAVAFVASTAVTFGAGQAGGVSGGVGGGAAGAAGGAGVLDEVWFDSITMFVFFLLAGRVLERRLHDRTAGALEALTRGLPTQVERRLADGGFERVAASALARGDVVRVAPGDVFPGDGELLEGITQVDEAMLTGESRPRHRAPGEPVLAGSHNLSGSVLVRIERLGADTRRGQVLALLSQAQAARPSAAALADRIARPFLALVLAAALLSAVLWWPVDPAHGLRVAIAVLVVTCPCALSLAVPAASLAAAGALARQGVLLRALTALETAPRIDTVVFDKTGTLTRDRMAVTGVRTRHGVSVDEVLALAGALAVQSLHPAAGAVADRARQAAQLRQGESGEPVARMPWSVRDVQESPGQGVEGRLTCEDAARCVASGMSGGAADDASAGALLRLGSASFCGAPPDHAQSDTSQVHLADERGWLASFDLDEQLRDDAAAVVAQLRARGLRVQLLSGDRTRAVERLGWRLGIEWCHGDRTPADKLAHVASLQKQGHRVLMVGDGVNDAPVLARADLSVSFAHAAPVSRAQADVVITGDGLGALVAVIDRARAARRVARQNIAWAAVYNAVCVPLAALGFMPPWLAGLGMAASSLLVVANSARLSR